MTASAPNEAENTAATENATSETVVNGGESVENEVNGSENQTEGIKSFQEDFLPIKFTYLNLNLGLYEKLYKPGTNRPFCKIKANYHELD